MPLLQGWAVAAAAPNKSSARPLHSEPKVPTGEQCEHRTASGLSLVLETLVSARRETVRNRLSALVEAMFEV